MFYKKGNDSPMESSSSTHVVIGQIALLPYKLLSYTKLLSVSYNVLPLLICDTPFHRVPTRLTILLLLHAVLWYLR
jgi:hypothetical protein